MKCKKIIAFLLVIVTLLAGCGRVSDTDSISNADAKEEGTSKDMVTLTWYIPGGKEAEHDSVMKEFNEKLAEKTNIQLDLQPIPFGDYDQKLNMMIASQEEFDLCFTSYWLGDFYKYAGQGGFLGLNELLVQVPELENKLGAGVLDFAKVNGEIYAIPSNGNLFLQFGVTIQKDLADKYGLDVDALPQGQGYDTMKALEPFLQAVVENEPGVYPYRARYAPYYDTFESIIAGVGIRKEDDSLQVVNIYETPEWEKSTRLMNDWFEKGYIRQDLASVTADDMDVQNNKYAMVPNAMVPGGLRELEVKQDTQLVAVAIEKLYTARNGGLQKATAISSTSKHPEEALKLLEIINTDKEMFNLLAFGIEGAQYNMIGDDQIELLPDSGYVGQNTWTIGNQLIKYYTKDQEVGLWDEIDRLNKESIQSPIKGFALDIEPIKNQIAKVNAVKSEYSLLENGVLDFDEYNDEFLEKLKIAGIDEILQEVQRQVDEWKANQ